MIDEIAARVRENIKRVIVGKDDVIDLMMIAVLSEGHVLLEDVPGTGKTTLAKSMAVSLGCTFRRIQFTPDLLPSDVTGINFFNQKTQAFEFRPGPDLESGGAGGRDQPRHAAHAKRPAGSDARAPDDYRRRNPSPAPPISGHGDSKPD